MISRIDISLIHSVNGIPFGTERVEVRSVLGNDFKEYRKSKFSKNSSDSYGDFHVYYSGDNKMVAVEIFTDIAVFVASNPISLEPTALIKWVKNIDPEAEEDSEGIISKKYSIGISAPNHKFESILFGKEEYYR